MRKLVVASLKGGTCKTTTAVSIAVGLAQRGKTVLVVDCDPQGNASWILSGGKSPDGPTLAEVLSRESSAFEAIRETTVQGLSLLPADVTLGATNLRLANEPGRDGRLRAMLGEVDGAFDFVLADTGPTVTTLWLNALAYAEEVIAPVDLGVLSVLGLVELESAIADLRAAYNPALRLAALVLTRVQKNNLARDVEGQLRERFGDRVCAATVPLTVKIDEAHSRGMTIMTYAPGSPGATAYKQIVEGLIDGGTTARRGRAGAGGHPRKAGAA